MMDTTQLLRDAAPIGFLKSPICRGRILAAPKTFGEPVLVILPEGSSERPYGPCKWAQIHGNALPVAGAECVLAFDERNQPTVVWWDGTYFEGAFALNEQIVSYTLTLEDAGKIIEMNNAGPVNLTVPPLAFPIGTLVDVAQMGVGQVTLKAGVGVTLLTPASLTTRTRYSTVGLRNRAANQWVVSGDLS